MKRVIRVIAFLLVFAALYIVVDGVLSTKTDDGVGVMKKYYALPEDTVDVLFVGSSHIGMNVDPSQLMEDEGIASYALWSGMQPVWNSYYYVKEAMKTQQPKVVVAEVFLCGTDVDYSDEVVALKSIQAMRFSMDKVNAAFASYATWQKAVEALWGMPYYHARYGELTAEDLNVFAPQDTSIQRAVHDMTRIIPQNMLDYANITEVHPLAEKQETYLRKLIDLCKSEKTPLVLLIAPFRATQNEAVRLNRVEEIAAQEGVYCLNYLKTYQADGIDAAADFYDEGHLNITGVPKFTASLGKHLKTWFDLPDRRLDRDHIWNGEQQTTESDGAVYRLEEVFVGGGKRYVDTGVKLYENIYGSWTLLTRIDTKTIGDDGVYMSCFSEDSSKGYYGFRLMKTADGLLQIKAGDNKDRTVTCEGDTMDIALVKEGTMYSAWVNGQIVMQNDNWPCDSYAGNLLLGCQELTAGGQKFRYSAVTVRNLEIYEEALSEATILNWSPEALPEPELPLGVAGQPEKIYTMPGLFDGAADGMGHVDTGLKLMDADGTRFTLLTSITPEQKRGDDVFISSFSETPDEYRGLLVRQIADDVLNILVGNNIGFNVPVTPGVKTNLAIVKDGNYYTVYADGEKVLDRRESPMTPYDGSLLLGAQRDANGNIFRISDTKVNSLTVYAGVLDEAAILAWPYEDAPAGVSPKLVRELYSLPNAFAGNGTENYVDSGVKLYDDPGKEWTLHTVVHPRVAGNDGVYFSCFSEEADHYRGLMLRQENDTSLTLYMGQLLTCPVPLAEGEEELALTVVKSGDQYTVYRNGELLTQTQVHCAAYEGELLIGCQATAEGDPFRFSTARIGSLKVWDSAMSANDVAALN